MATIVQQAGGFNTNAPNIATFGATPIAGNLIVFVVGVRGDGTWVPVGLSDAAISGAAFTSLYYYTDSSLGALGIYAKIADSSQTQFGSTAAGSGKSDKVRIYEVSGAALAGYEVKSKAKTNSNSGDPGSFATSSALDFIVEAILSLDSGPPTYTVSGFTQDDVYSLSPSGYTGHRAGSGGAVATAFSFSGFCDNVAAAVRFSTSNPVPRSFSPGIIG